jgi:uncharacterized iron-regulated protein
VRALGKAMNFARCLIVAVLALATFASNASACTHERGPFLQELARVSKSCAHPLCGRILAIGKANPGDPCTDEPWILLKSAASAAISTGGVLILGETHDNAVHHLLQAAAVSEFAAQGSSNTTAIVFEQFRDDQQAGVDQFRDLERTGGPATVADLKRLVNWGKSGWPDLYDPLFDVLIASKHPFYAGDVSRAEIMNAAKDGEAALSADDRKRLGLDIPLGKKFDAASIKEIEHAHCGALPKEAFGGMAYAQRYRDAHLADAMLKAAQRDGSAILIAGTGHARTDRGVPRYIRERAPEKKVVTVMFIEVEDGNGDGQSYVPLDPDAGPAADFIVFTPRAERSDPCEKMRKK